MEAMTSEFDKNHRTSGMFCHLASFAGYVIPFGNIVGPLIVWLLKKDESPFVDHHGKEALNFQITIFLYLLISVVLIFLLVGFVLLPLVGLLNVICTIIAAVKANDGVYYRYPFCIRLL